MMPNKRLLGLVPEATRPILLKVLFSWFSLAAGIVLFLCVPLIPVTIAKIRHSDLSDGEACHDEIIRRRKAQ